MASAPPLEPSERLVQAQGGSAEAWLSGLPALVEDLLKRWELTPERVVVPGGRTSMAVLVRRADGVPAVLKLCSPAMSARLEYEALQRWNGLGAVRALRCSLEAGALLLERLRAETSLRALPEAKAMLEAVSAVRRLWVDPGPDHPFPTVAERTAEMVAAMRARTVAEEVAALVEEAEELREQLLAAPAGAERFLLHGDFRQGAVLASDSERAPWLVVGPEPVVGERAYDLARLARDRLHDLVASPGAAAVTRRRVGRLAEAVEVDAGRLRDWALFRSVASGVRHLAAGHRADGEMLLEFATWL